MAHKPYGVLLDVSRLYAVVDEGREVMWSGEISGCSGAVRAPKYKRLLAPATISSSSSSFAPPLLHPAHPPR